MTNMHEWYLNRAGIADEIALALSEWESEGSRFVLMRGASKIYTWERFDRLVRWAERTGKVMAHP